ncbi:hypothetical protein GCM10022221_81790 [Actinocorallia aurea]
MTVSPKTNHQVATAAPQIQKKALYRIPEVMILISQSRSQVYKLIASGEASHRLRGTYSSRPRPRDRRVRRRP